MKTKRKVATALGESDLVWEGGLPIEIDSFLRALSSYPEQFAREPHLSFQQHFSSIVTAAHVSCPAARQRG